MGWEDRQYNRDSSGGELPSALRFLINGSVPLFTAFGIRVRLHITLILFIVLTLVLGGLGTKSTYILQYRLQSMIALFVIVLLHEFGHCFASRWVGGDPEEIMLSPLGGLAMANAPHRPGATFITVAGGPAVNVVICLIMGLAIYLLTSHSVWNPVGYYQNHLGASGAILGFAYWIYAISLALLLFNLLPFFPLDGGQLLQSAIWFKLGWHRSMNIACVIGLVGGGMMILVGFATSLLVLLIGLSCVLTCVSTRRQLREMGPEFDYGQEPMDFSASLRPDPPKRRRRASRWAIRRLQRQAEQEVAEQERIDTILAKVSAKGISSLTWSEKRALHRATERQRRREREVEPSKGR